MSGQCKDSLQERTPCAASEGTRYSFLIVNGPNLAHLGERQPEVYGTQSLEDIPALVGTLLGANADTVDVCFFQSNSEGGIIDRLELARGDGTHGIVINAGAYTHTSLAIADCIAWIGLPVVEVHASNIFSRRNPLRRQSFLGAHAIGLVAGFGIMSYALAVQALYTRLRSGTFAE